MAREIFKQVGVALNKIQGLVGEQEEGREEVFPKVAFPKSVASAVFRLSKSTFDKLEVRGQRLEIAVEADKVIVSLKVSRESIDETYDYLYGYTQSLITGQGATYLKINPPPELAREVIGEEPFEYLPEDEDFNPFLFKLYVVWRASSQTDNAKHPKNLF